MLDDQTAWLISQVDGLTDHITVMSPSEWAETVRYLPPQVTPLPGYYRFTVAPYLREIVDCLGVESPVRELAVIKGVQLGLTVGVLENAIGYYIDHVKTSPMMLVTADAELAKLRMESYITPMLNYSGLDHLIKSSDERNTRKTGKTDKKLEWEGGGFLVPLGARNADKLRSISIQVLLRDEIDAFADTVGKDGDPLKLSADRTAAYESSRKIADISTPLIAGQSKIQRQFGRGDQRYYYIRCLSCGFPQVLRWSGVNKETGEAYGILWETENGRLIYESVRYLCRNCQHEHFNDDKKKLLDPAYGAEWRPTATPIAPDIRSYHINALYSPVGMQSWATSVQKWLEAWDDKHNRAKDNGLLQVFYNNVLAEPFEIRGDKVRFATVSAHRRRAYSFGQVPNDYAETHAESPILLLVCTVDVQKADLSVAVHGFAKGRRAFLVDYWRFEGDTEQLDDAATWGRLRDLVENGEYIADDGRRYRITMTLVDSGYRPEVVHRFCADYVSGVFAIRGVDAPPKRATIKEFTPYRSPMGTTAYHVTVDIYKDRWAAALRRGWDGLGLQPEGHYNAPIDATDAQLKELTVEYKREKIEARTGKRIGHEWHRPKHADNELWDLLVYANAALDMTAWDVCVNRLELDAVNWPAFWDMLHSEKVFFAEADK